MLNGITGNNYSIGYGNNYKSVYKNGINGSDGTNKMNGVGKKECQTCKNREYVDGSNESNVSFKTPGHIDPQVSASVVAAHERQHVDNAVHEGNKEGNKLLSASVSLETSTCPECGRVYVSGGKTRTLMEKSNENTKLNPYNRGEELVKRFLMQGMNVDLSA